MEAAVASAVSRAARRVQSLQLPDGHWCAELTSDTTLESDYILFQLWLYPPAGGRWEPPTRPLVEKAARSILERQLPDGGFNIYPEGPAEVSASVKAYFALKLAGIALDDERMTRLRRRILELGGIRAANSYVKVNLSLFGLYPRRDCPSIPPEATLLPFGFLYQVSAWTRTIIVPLSIILALNPKRPAPEGFDLDEIRGPEPSSGAQPATGGLDWRTLFLGLDRAFKTLDPFAPQALRGRALKRAERWMLERMRHADGLGAIYPAMMYGVMALDALGYGEDDPVRVEALRQFDRLIVDDGSRFLLQPCFSPVWDTAIGAYALAQSGSGTEEALRGLRWLLPREVRRKGDWAFKRPGAEPSGWAFEYSNEHYPDVDDTAMVLLALNAAGAGDTEIAACARRAADWLIAMQCRDGGWAAFDADNDWRFLRHVPFADHNAMLDPACADITGRVLEGLASQGVPAEQAAVKRGVDWLTRNQEADGSWYGRWGVAYVYGTCFALRGLAASGVSDREASVLRGGEWLRSVQNADGGWGESCASYDNGTFTPARSTPSQTAWAILGLIAGGDLESRSVRQGIEYLVATQLPEGGWDEKLATGSGFPGVFYLNYGLYKDYFPLLALATCLKTRTESNG